MKRQTFFLFLPAIVLTLLLSTLPADGKQVGYQYRNMKPKPKLLFDKWARARNKSEGISITPRQRFEKLTVSQRSTFAALTNALLSSKLTNSSGRSLGTAIDLVAEIEQIAGEEEGKGSDEQFRFYVKLNPDALKKLDGSREFQHGKNNTVFHKGYPINYRQEGSPPTLQYSISTEGIRADIDIDYRSSGFPAALFNGHLSASNSDVRAAGNYLTHLRRWAGLIDWWDEVIPDPTGDSSADWYKNRTPPALLDAAHKDAPESELVSAAASEFFKTWLIDRDHDRAMNYVQKQLTFCSDLKNVSERRQLESREKLLFYDTLKAANKEIKKTKSLDQAIRPVPPVDPFIKPVEHGHKDLYTLAVITDGDYQHFVCSSRTSELTAQKTAEQIGKYGGHYVVKFRFALENGKGGILRLLWTKENGSWMIESFDAVTS